MITIQDCINNLRGDGEAGEILYNWLDWNNELNNDPNEVFTDEHISKLINAADDDYQARVVAYYADLI